jgi:hypothetical protein
MADTNWSKWIERQKQARVVPPRVARGIPRLAEPVEKVTSGDDPALRGEVIETPAPRPAEPPAERPSLAPAVRHREVPAARQKQKEDGEPHSRVLEVRNQCARLRANLATMLEGAELPPEVKAQVEVQLRDAERGLRRAVNACERAAVALVRGRSEERKALSEGG